MTPIYILTKCYNDMKVRIESFNFFKGILLRVTNNIFNAKTPCLLPVTIKFGTVTNSLKKKT